MTKETTIPNEFRAMFHRLVVTSSARRLDPGTLEAYWSVLSDVPMDALETAVRQLARAQPHFPTTGEWFHAAQAVQAEARRRRLEADPPIDLARYECDRCQDTGSVYIACPRDARCGRTHPHAPHPFVCVCACRPTNRTFQRNRHEV
jgi:hypothetical protein